MRPKISRKTRIVAKEVKINLNLSYSELLCVLIFVLGHTYYVMHVDLNFNGFKEHLNQIIFLQVFNFLELRLYSGYMAFSLNNRVI